jgi:hypothetical protein
MKTLPVTACGECPFVFADPEDNTWRCTAVEDGPMPEINDRMGIGGIWPPPPAWCPLREGDRLVTLRATETVVTEKR